MSNDGYGGSGGLTMGPIEMKEWNVLKFTELGDALNCMKEYGVKNPDQLVHYGDSYYVYLPKYIPGKIQAVNIMDSHQ